MTRSDYFSPLTFTGNRVATSTLSAPATRQATFAKLDNSMIETLSEYVAKTDCRTCDCSVGGIMMWADYFNYTYMIFRNTLFIKGVAENDLSKTAFSIPMGEMPLAESLQFIRSYCTARNILPVLSAVSESDLEKINELTPCKALPLEDWGDYIYDIERMSTFSGKKMAKKRNHLNRFNADHPDCEFVDITPDNVHLCIDMLRGLEVGIDKPLTADYEREKTFEVLENLDRYPFEGIMAIVPGKGVAAFTLGEVVGDTLMAHIEKINHEISGAGEAVSSKFCSIMRQRHPQLRFVNREEDAGDPGLRKAKLAYQPSEIIKKYNVMLL
ncbi:MAG: phosphatidylglycerol lysyltransferase domain-containing protein [Paramuribaculum sp.]|nr:phosphatidylglycerol lysyltransferase domain-containing protein [Paramuribaculum sp.]